MKSIPEWAAKRIARTYEYDQVIIIARKIGEEPEEHGVCVATYGVDKQHGEVAATLGEFFKRKILFWKQA